MAWTATGSRRSDVHGAFKARRVYDAIRWHAGNTASHNAGDCGGPRRCDPSEVMKTELVNLRRNNYQILCVISFAAY
jgi:hypothetical protein